MPGPFERLDTVTMDFNYAEYFKADPTTGYETLLFDAMTGDQTLFHRMDMVEAGWQAVDADPRRLEKRRELAACRPTSRGRGGRREADLLIERDGRAVARLTIVGDKVAMSDDSGRAHHRADRIGDSRRAVLQRCCVDGRRHARRSSINSLADPSRPWHARIEWEHLHLFWGDERERAARSSAEQLRTSPPSLIAVRGDPTDTQVHRMRGELPASDAGRLYDAVLRARRDRVAGALFDVMLLGIGANAHIASIFPDSPLLVRGPKGSAPR